MMTKSTDEKAFKWINIGKGVGIGLAIIFGSIGGSTGLSALGVVGGSATESTAKVQEMDGRLELHKATDSVRWVYMERKISDMDRKLDYLVERAK
jgi:F0F1-type ATP synthase membrane subunit c/vacuolar-type H+-ATPase subunit K